MQIWADNNRHILAAASLKGDKRAQAATGDMRASAPPWWRAVVRHTRAGYVWPGGDTTRHCFREPPLVISQTVFVCGLSRFPKFKHT